MFENGKRESLALEKIDIVENLFRSVTQQIKVIWIIVLQFQRLTMHLILLNIQFWEMKPIFIGKK